MIVFAQTSGNPSTNSESWTPIPGLSLKVPGGFGEAVLLILNVPNPHAIGPTYPTGYFGIEVDGQLQTPIASFVFNSQTPPSSTTLCVPVKLNSTNPSAVTAVWYGHNNTTVTLFSQATLAAVVG